VSEGEIMTLCGWKTRTMFDRYNIIDETDLAEGVATRLKDQPRANKRANNGEHWHSHHIPQPAKFCSCIGSAR